MPAEKKEDRQEVKLLFYIEDAKEPIEVSIPYGTKVSDLAHELTKKGASIPPESFIFIEDEDQPLDGQQVFDKLHNSKIIHITHRLRRIDVAIHFNGDVRQKDFAPSTRIKKILEWAVGPKGFKVDPAIAPEMQLQITGQSAALNGNAHISSFVPVGTNRLDLDLTRGIIPNGSERW